jgi:hypothetical protein
MEPSEYSLLGFVAIASNCSLQRTISLYAITALSEVIALEEKAAFLDWLH